MVINNPDIVGDNSYNKISDKDIDNIKILAEKLTKNYTLPLKDQKWKSNIGSFMGVDSGSSIDFHDHRNYLPGDDPRHINWSAYAKTGTYSMKLYKNEVQPIIDIILDTSNSMTFFKKKILRSLEIFTFCASSALHSETIPNLYFTGLYNTEKINLENLTSEKLYKLIKKTNQPSKNQKPLTNYSSVKWEHPKLKLRSNSIRIIISDLLYPVDPELIINTLKVGNARCIYFCPFLESESNPKWQGNMDLIDTETSKKNIFIIKKNTLSKYKSAYNKHFEIWDQKIKKYQFPFARLPCDDNFSDNIINEAVSSRSIITKN